MRDVPDATTNTVAEDVAPSGRAHEEDPLVDGLASSECQTKRAHSCPSAIVSPKRKKRADDEFAEYLRHEGAFQSEVFLSGQTMSWDSQTPVGSAAHEAAAEFNRLVTSCAKEMNTIPTADEHLCQPLA